MTNTTDQVQRQIKREQVKTGPESSATNHARSERTPTSKENGNSMTTAAVSEQTAVAIETATLSRVKTVPSTSAGQSADTSRKERIKPKETTSRTAMSATTITATTEGKSATTEGKSATTEGKSATTEEKSAATEGKSATTDASLARMTRQPLSASRSARSRLRESQDLEIVDVDDKTDAKEIRVRSGQLKPPAPGRSGSLCAPIDCEVYEPPDVIIMIEPLDTETTPESDTKLSPSTDVKSGQSVAPSVAEKKSPSLTQSVLRRALPNVGPSGGRITQQSTAPTGGSTTFPNLKLDAEKYKTLRALILQAVRVCMSHGEGFGFAKHDLESSPGETASGLRVEAPRLTSSPVKNNPRAGGSSGEQSGTSAGDQSDEHGYPAVPRSVGVGDGRGAGRREAPTPSDQRASQSNKRRKPTLREILSGTVPPKQCSVHRGARRRRRSKSDASSESGDDYEGRINVDDTDTDTED